MALPSLTATEIANMRGDLEAVELKMSCTIQRFTATGTDAHGQATGTWANLATGVPCWWWEEREIEVIGSQKSAVISTQWMAFEWDRDIRADDRVTLVTGVDASTVASSLQIREVHKRLVNTRARVEQVTTG